MKRERDIPTDSERLKMGSDASCARRKCHVEVKRRRARLGFTVLAFGFVGMGTLTLARWFLFLPLADGIGVAHNDFVHPGEGLRDEHSTLEETQVSTMQRQSEDHVFFLFWKVKMNQWISEL